MNPILDIRQEYILPIPFRVFGFFLVLIGLGASASFGFSWFSGGAFSWWVPAGIILAVLGGAIAFSHYRLAIDTGVKTVNVYVWVLGFHQGSPTSFECIDLIFVNRVLQSTRMSSYTGHPSELKEFLYKAFIRLDTGEKIHLDSDKNEEVLEGRLKKYVNQLGSLYTGADFKG